MCTVTFIASEDKVIITSNRDEHISRRANLKPKTEILNGIRVLYPKDKTAGGTWFALNEKGSVAVLLNGAFKNHKRTPPYKKSRGQIVLDIISDANPVTKIEEINLRGIEQFTLVLYHESLLYEFRWDGQQKHWKRLNKEERYIWSSWTLYDEEAQFLRDQLFKEFIANTDSPDSKSIVAFHQHNNGDFENGFVIDRKNGLKTLSITQAILTSKSIALDHHDLDQEHIDSTVVTPILSVPVQ